MTHCASGQIEEQGSGAGGGEQAKRRVGEQETTGHRSLNRHIAKSTSGSGGQNDSGRKRIQGMRAETLARRFSYRRERDVTNAGAVKISGFVQVFVIFGPF
jgi:hypothetical protein